MNVVFKIVPLVLFFWILPVESFAVDEPEPPVENTAYILGEVPLEAYGSALADLSDISFEGIYQPEADAPEEASFTYNVYYHSGGVPVKFEVSKNDFVTRQAADDAMIVWAPKVGQMPFVSLANLTRVVALLKGDESWSGGGGGLTIHTDTTADIGWSTIHEACHLLDHLFDQTAWDAALAADGNYPSNHARDNRERESKAEACTAWFLLRTMRDHMSVSMAEALEESSREQFAYLDILNLNIGPFLESEFRVNRGLPTAWYEAATDGQGFYITSLSGLGIMSLGWYTYDHEGLPIWRTASGLVTGGVADLTVWNNTGGRFDKGDPITREQDGTLVIHFESCVKATAYYDVVSLEASGEMDLTPISGDKVPLCESEELKLKLEEARTMHAVLLQQ